MMTTDALGFTLALITVGITMVAIRSRQMMINFGAAVLWSSLLAYILANSTAGESWQQIFFLSAVTFILALFFLALLKDTKDKNGKLAEYNGSEHGGFKGFLHRLNNDEMPSRVNNSRESAESYRARVHHALGRDRRRRR